MTTSYVLRVLLFSGIGFALGAFVGHVRCNRRHDK